MLGLNSSDIAQDSTTLGPRLSYLSLPLEAQVLEGSISLLWNLVRKKGEMSLRFLTTVKFYFTKTKMTSLINFKGEKQSSI